MMRFKIQARSARAQASEQAALAGQRQVLILKTAFRLKPVLRTSLYRLPLIDRQITIVHLHHDQVH